MWQLMRPISKIIATILFNKNLIIRCAEQQTIYKTTKDYAIQE